MSADQEIADDLRTELLRHLREVRMRLGGVAAEDIQRQLPITYGDLVRLTGRDDLIARGIGKYLTNIGDRCAEDGQPRLDYLVVTRKTGRPGKPVDEEEWRRVVLDCFRCEGFQKFDA